MLKPNQVYNDKTKFKIDEVKMRSYFYFLN